jgi:glycosyltransferase involved in cell wall biosynthesis
VNRIVQLIYDWKPYHGGAEKLLSHLKECETTINKFEFTTLIKTDYHKINSLESNSIYGLNPLINTIKYASNFSQGDMIHAHLFPTTYYTAIAKKFGFLKAHLVITEHNSTNRRRKIWLKWLDRLMYYQYDAIICISEGVKQSLVQWLPEVKNKCHVVYNGTKISGNREFIPNNGNPKLLSVGRLVEQKNYPQILDILSPILKDQKLNYTIAGEGILRNQIEKFIVESQIKSQVKLLGRIPDVTQEYQTHDIFIILSKWEGFGLACVEALSYGLRVIASDAEGMREILLPILGKGVLLVDLNDNNEIIRNQIQEFILKADTKEDFDLRIRRARDFDIQETAIGYVEVYKSLMGVC